jgi:hypothetical protein
MRNNTSLKLFVATLSASFVFYSCQKSIDEQADINKIGTVANSSNSNQRVTPYKFERINVQNFSSQGWIEQQVNNLSGGLQVFSDFSDHVEIVCGPENSSDPRLIPGCITMNLPTGADPTLRRIRLRRGGYSGTLLADLTELKFSTYVVQNAPVAMVLQIDVNGDADKDFNIFWEPRAIVQPPGFPPLVLNTWQQWDALNVGEWHPEISIVPIPQHLQDGCTIEELIAAFPNARIIDTEPIGHNGEGVRFTIGGNPRNLFDNTIGYFDALIIGTKNEQQSTLYDFTCSPGND